MIRAWLSVNVTICSPFYSHGINKTMREITSTTGEKLSFVETQGAVFNLASSGFGSQIVARSQIAPSGSDDFYSTLAERSTQSGSRLPSAAICLVSAGSLTIDKYDVSADNGNVIDLVATQTAGWGVEPSPSGAATIGNYLSIIEGLIGSSLAPDTSRMTAIAFNSSALLQAEQAIPPGQTMTLSEAQVAMIVNKVWSKRSEGYLKQFKIDRGEKIWNVVKTAPNGWTTMEGFKSKVTLPAPISERIRIPVNIDADGVVTIDDSADESAYAAQDAYTFTMQKAIATWRTGTLREADMPSADRPAETTSDALSNDVRTEMDKWWAQMLELRTQLLLKIESQPTDIKTQYQTQTPGITDDQIRAIALTGASASQSSTWWSNVKTSMSGAAGWLGDLLKSWGPTGIVGAWAGVTAVNSAKKSTVPAWLIIGGLGLIAYKLVK